MRLCIYDPAPSRNEYCTFFLRAFRRFRVIENEPTLEGIRNSIVLLLSDYLLPEVITMLKNNGNKIVGINVTDSSYISQSCRFEPELALIDLMFMLSGIQRVNIGYETAYDKDFNVTLQERQFLPPEHWSVFDSLRASGKLQSLPYVHWDRQPEVNPQPYALRSQKAFIRGGGHMRRILLALHLMRLDLLDINSGFMLRPYFDPLMNPQFRYCDDCQSTYKQHGRYEYEPRRGRWSCNSIAKWGDSVDLSDLSAWNNRCPASFMWLAEKFGGVNLHDLEFMLNADWLPADEHLRLLSRMAFTSDLKWLFSIYAPQRFWDGAMAGAINVLPERTTEQEYFPAMFNNEHYMNFGEDMTGLAYDFHVDEANYNRITHNARALYDQWIKPTDLPISSNLLRHVFELIDRL